jgi:hypothetical protein
MTQTAQHASGAAVAVAPDATPQTATGTSRRAAPDRTPEKHPPGATWPHHCLSLSGGRHRIAGA